MAFVAAFWCSTNTTIYPTELYGDVLKLQLDIFPYFIDTDTSLIGGISTGRAWLSNTHYFVGFAFLQGHLFHGLRAMGFDFNRVGKWFEDAGSGKITLN